MAPIRCLASGPAASLAFDHTGAALTTTHTLKHALVLAEHDGLASIHRSLLGTGNLVKGEAFI